jgi:hypothetical protein
MTQCVYSLVAKLSGVRQRSHTHAIKSDEKTTDVPANATAVK